MAGLVIIAAGLPTGADLTATAGSRFDGYADDNDSEPLSVQVPVAAENWPQDAVRQWG